MLKWLSDVFWDDKLWLGPGIKWVDVTNGPDKKVVYPESADFYIVLPLTVAMLILRFGLEKYCFTTLGLAVGIKDAKRRKPQDIPILESAYRQSPLIKDVTSLAKQLDLSERQVERWWRLRRNQDKATTLAKFCECCWKAFYLVCSCSYGYYVLRDKEWFWDLDKCYIGYPHQGVTSEVRWFFIMYMTYICSSLITISRDVKRKDYKILIAHHVAAMSLLYMSWVAFLFRSGAVLGLVLDSSDTILEITKAFKTAKFDGVAKVTFIFFALIWFYTRLYLFPLHLYSTLVTAPIMLRGQNVPFTYVVNIFLFFILLLSMYWSVLVLKVLYSSFRHGCERDLRSSSSEASDDDLISERCLNNNGANGLCGFGKELGTQ